MITIHYDEIALKGRNRGKFVKILEDSVEYLSGKRPKDVSGRLLIEDVDTKFLNILPGVSWFGKVEIFQKLEEVKEFLEKSGKKYKIDVRRIDKSLPFTSLDAKRELIKYFDKQGPKLRIDIFSDKILVSYDIKEGIGGLPIGSAGKVIHLFSGGKDSSVAAIELMKRGAAVDLLHVYALSDEIALKGKVGKIAKYLSNLSPIKLYLVPFNLFYSKIISLNTKYEIVLFKHFLLLLADKFKGYLGIGTGDSLSQVSSQTLANLYAVNQGIEKPILRPLLSLNKREIIEKSIEYGLYELANEEYKDCCSIIARNNTTHAKREVLRELEGKIGLSEIVDKSFSLKTYVYLEHGEIKSPLSSEP